MTSDEQKKAPPGGDSRAGLLQSGRVSRTSACAARSGADRSGGHELRALLDHLNDATRARLDQHGLGRSRPCSDRVSRRSAAARRNRSRRLPAARRRPRRDPECCSGGTRSRTMYSRNAGRCSTAMPAILLDDDGGAADDADRGRALRRAATGTPTAPVITAAASILFRMVHSFGRFCLEATNASGADFAGTMRVQCIARADVPRNALPHSRHFRADFVNARNPARQASATLRGGSVVGG